jgi:hypothetical protein
MTSMLMATSGYITTEIEGKQFKLNPEHGGCFRKKVAGI